MRIRIGTRGSALARWQAEHVQGRLEQAGHEVVLHFISTTGDRTPGALAGMPGASHAIAVDSSASAVVANPKYIRWRLIRRSE